MLRIAYLFNRFPEISLRSLQTEVETLASDHADVICFAHRKSEYPLLKPADQRACDSTQYLAEKRYLGLLLDVLRCVIQSPARFVSAVHALVRLDGSPVSRIGHLALACRLVQQLNRQRIERLHVHFAGGPSNVAMLCRLLGGPPWTITIHGPEDLEIDSLRSLRDKSASFDAALAITELAAERLRDAGVTEQARVHVVRMPVSPLFLAPASPPPVKPSLCCVARLDPRKGLNTLVDAIHQLRADGREISLRVIGGGPSEAELCRQIEQHDLGRCISLLGWQDESRVLQEIDNSQCFVLPSLDEGLPVSIMEAMARARPVIATDVGGIRELVEHETNGLLIPPNDPVALAEAIRSILDQSAAKRTVIGERGRERVMAQHEANRQASQLKSIWRDLSTEREAL